MKRHRFPQLRMFLVAMVLAAGLGAQQPTWAQAASAMEEANAHYQAQEWEQAAAAYAAIAQADSTQGLMWYRWGYALSQLGKYREAADVYEQMVARGRTQPVVKYQLGVAYALMGAHEEAFNWLGQAVEEGYARVQYLESDTSLAALRTTSEDRFAQIVEQADENALPCEYSEKHRQFDFWIGEWEVYNPQEQRVGTNSIQKAENGCVLVEDWTSAGGGTGMSINYYDPGKDQWVQQWVAASGTLVQIEGGLTEDGAMLLEGELVSVNGQTTPFRGTWTPLSDGRVRQFFEQSTDGGETWTTWFDGYYVRRDEERE